MEKTIINTSVRRSTCKNAYDVKVKRCCASCQHKCIDKDGNRICAQMMIIVEQKFRCKQWQMSDGLKNAGKSGGTVRNRYNKEVEIG